MSRWIEVHDKSVQATALKLARGQYQRALLQGEEALSGSTLKGTARSWGASYARSRKSLLDQLTSNNVPWGVRVGDKGRRILVLGVGCETQT